MKVEFKKVKDSIIYGSLYAGQLKVDQSGSYVRLEDVKEIKQKYDHLLEMVYYDNSHHGHLQNDTIKMLKELRNEKFNKNKLKE